MFPSDGRWKPGSRRTSGHTGNSGGLTQEQLAEVLGVSVGAVYKWESRSSLPELRLIMEMADFFDVSVDALLGYRQPIPGKFPPVPDLAASGLWSTPKELLMIAKAFMKSLHGDSTFLQTEAAREMARPVMDFPWTCLGMFMGGEDILVSQGWGENGQCMMKMNVRTKRIAVVMANRNPGVDQAESGIEALADGKLNEKE